MPAPRPALPGCHGLPGVGIASSGSSKLEHQGLKGKISFLSPAPGHPTPLARAIKGHAETPQLISPSHPQPPKNCRRGTKPRAQGKREWMRARGSSCDPSPLRSQGASPAPLPRVESGCAPSSTGGLQTIQRFMRGRGLRDLCHTLTVKRKHIPLRTWLGPLSEEFGVLTPEVRMSL